MACIRKIALLGIGRRPQRPFLAVPRDQIFFLQLPEQREQRIRGYAEPRRQPVCVLGLVSQEIQDLRFLVHVGHILVIRERGALHLESEIQLVEPLPKLTGVKRHHDHTLHGVAKKLPG